MIESRRWHFIGPAASTSNVKTVMKCRNLFMVETLQSVKVADLMNDSLMRTKQDEKLNVMIQSKCIVEIVSSIDVDFALRVV